MAMSSKVDQTPEEQPNPWIAVGVGVFFLLCVWVGGGMVFNVIAGRGAFYYFESLSPGPAFWTTARSIVTAVTLLALGIAGAFGLRWLLAWLYSRQEAEEVEELEVREPRVNHWREQRQPAAAESIQALEHNIALLRRENGIIQGAHDELVLANGGLKDQLSRTRASHAVELQQAKQEAGAQAQQRYQALLEQEKGKLAVQFRAEVERAVQQKSADLEQRLATQARELAMLKPVAEAAKQVATERDELKQQLAGAQQEQQALLAKLAALEAEPQQTASWREQWLVLGKMIEGAAARPTLALRPTRDWLRELGGGIGKSEEEWGAFKAFVHLLASTTSTSSTGEGEPSSPTSKTAPITPISTLEIPAIPQTSAGEEGERTVDAPVVDGGRGADESSGRPVDEAVDAVVDAPASVRERLDRARNRKPSMFSGYRARTRAKRA
jgi:hypothetical protein